MQTLYEGYKIFYPLRHLSLVYHRERDIIKVDISIPRLVRFVSQLPSAYMVLIMLYVSKQYNVLRKIRKQTFRFSCCKLLNDRLEITSLSEIVLIWNKNEDPHTLFFYICILNIHEIYGNGIEYGIHIVMVLSFLCWTHHVMRRIRILVWFTDST